MTVTTAITKPLEQGYLQVDVKHKNGYTRYFKVPQGNAKRFANEFKQQDKELNLYSNITFFTSIFAGVLGASLFTKNLESRLTQFLIQTAAAIGLSGLTSFNFNKYALCEEEKLIKSHKAKEIFYREV